MGSIAALAGILSLIYLLFFEWVLDDRFLNASNQKNGVAIKLSMTSQELEKVVHEMIAYVKGETQDAQVIVEISGKAEEFYSGRELSHLGDVRKLVHYGDRVALALLVLSILGECFLIYWKKIDAICHGIYFSWIILLVLAVFTGIIAMLDMKLFVFGFHKLFFSNSNWILNPVFDRSVRMFCDSLYIDALIKIIEIFAVVFALSIVLARSIKKWCKI